MAFQSYRDLIVWQKSIILVKEVYIITNSFPRSEQYGLSAQMRSAAVSIPSNIAEGRSRGTRRDFRHFLLNAFGSGAELETQIVIAKQLPFGELTNFQKSDELLGEVMRMLNSMIAKL